MKMSHPSKDDAAAPRGLGATDRTCASLRSLGLSSSAGADDARRRSSHLSASSVDPDARRSSVSIGTSSDRTSRLSSAVLEAADSSRKTISRRRAVASSLARLRLDSTKLHGREKDVHLLRETLTRVVAADGARRETILVAGRSGVGKSALVARGLQFAAKKKGMAFVSGKFDLNKNALPFSAFAGALASLAKHVGALKNANYIRSHIWDELGDDVHVIRSAMPGCGELFSAPEQSNRRESVTGGKEAVNRLHYTVRRLVKVICANLKSGMVLFIDDLQWADSSSLDLLQSLMLDENIPSFLIVGAYRDDEVAESHPLSLSIGEAERLGANITTIQLGNLKFPSMQSLIAEALNMDDGEESEVETLARTVYKKTDGNPFFVLAFLGSLYDNELLQYNFAIERWRWDDERVDRMLMTENVVSIMLNKLKTFAAKAQTIMKIASCLGASFDRAVLSTVVEKSSSDEIQSNFVGEEDIGGTISHHISEFEDEGLWESDSDGVCRFGHDQIQSAALELIPVQRRDSFRGEIGATLMENLDPSVLEKYLFDVVSLCNCSTESLSVLERQGLGLMNFRAGSKASKSAAFDMASVYYETARGLLREMPWDDERDLMVKLYIAEANARFVVGDLGTVDELVDELLSHDLRMWDRFKAIEVKILTAQAANRFDEAITLALDLRRDLGFKSIPTKVSKVTILREYVKTNRAIKGRSAEELASLPTLTDERVIIGQRMLGLLLTSAYQANPSMYPMIPFWSLQQTVSSGINSSSAESLVTFGLLLW